VDTLDVPPLSDRAERCRASVELTVSLPAEMATPSVARQHLGRWLDAHDWPLGQHDDLILAVSEAVSNSVEHGYGVDHTTAGHTGGVEVHGVMHTSPDGRRHTVITVVDHGAWLTPSQERSNRRHGLPLMEACAEALTVDGTGHGTTVVLRSRPVPAPLNPT